MRDLIELVKDQQVLILAAEFEENAITISYQEKRHVGESALKAQTIMIAIDTEKKQEQYMALQSDLIDMVDDAEIDIRENPLEG